MMATDKKTPTAGQMVRSLIKQRLRAALKLSIDSLSTRFARRQTINFTCAGQTIRGCFYYPRSNGKTPGILLLPTAAGLTPHEHAFAARLAREGYTTLVIAYSKRTTGAVIKDDLARKYLQQVVLTGWRFLQSNHRIEPMQTAVIGLSLGGYFATYIGTLHKELAPKAVVVYYGMYALAGSELRHLRAPLLILQGEDDDADFVRNAKRVQELAIRDDQPWEVVFYPRTGHQFDLFEPNGAAARDASEQTARFLRQYLETSKL